MGYSKKIEKNSSYKQNLKSSNITKIKILGNPNRLSEI